MEGFTQTQVSTLAVKDNLLVAGGFQGELICKVSGVTFFPPKSFTDITEIRKMNKPLYSNCGAPFLCNVALSQFLLVT